MFGFEVPHTDVIAIENHSYHGESVAVATPPGGLIDVSSDRRLAVVEGRVVDAECHKRDVLGSYQTWRPIIPPCPYFG